MHYYGDIALGDELIIPFDTVNTSGGSADYSTDPGLRAYKDDGTAQITAGLTFTEAFDGVTGIHIVTVDTSDPAYEANADYFIVATVGVIDGQTVSAVIGSFSIENRNNHDVIIGSVTNTPSDGSACRDSTRSTTDNLYNGMVFLPTSGLLRGIPRRVEDYDGTTKEFSFTDNPYPITIPAGTRYRLIGLIES